MSRITESLYRVTGAQLNESACTRLADTDAQEETISKIEKCAKACGVTLFPGTKVGKRPQRVILDWRHQDGFVSVSANGSFSIGNKDFGSYKDSYFDINEVSPKEIKACFSSYLNEGQTWRALKDPISKLYKEKEELEWELESMQKGSFDHAPDPSAWDLLREKEIRDRLKEINKQLEEFERDPITQEIDTI